MKRYFDEQHNPLPEDGSTSDIFIECANEQEFYRAVNPDWLEWNGDVPSFRTQEEVDAILFQRKKDNMTIIPKLNIRRAFRSLTIEDQLDALINSQVSYAKDWADAVDIDLTDPILIEALSGSEIDIDAIKTEILNQQSL